MMPIFCLTRTAEFSRQINWNQRFFLVYFNRVQDCFSNGLATIAHALALEMAGVNLHKRGTDTTAQTWPNILYLAVIEWSSIRLEFGGTGVSTSTVSLSNSDYLGHREPANL